MGVGPLPKEMRDFHLLQHEFCDTCERDTHLFRNLPRTHLLVTDMHAYMRACVHAYMRACVYIYIYIYIYIERERCMCIYIYIHTHVYIYIYICICIQEARANEQSFGLVYAERLMFTIYYYIRLCFIMLCYIILYYMITWAMLIILYLLYYTLLCYIMV